jgi:tape measure domain-containing protein
MAGLDVGNIYASLGGRFDDRGFRLFDSAATSATTKATRMGAVGSQAMAKVGESAAVAGHRVERAMAGAEAQTVRSAHRMESEQRRAASASGEAWTLSGSRISGVLQNLATRGGSALLGLGVVAAGLGVRFDAMKESAEIAFGTLLHDAAAGRAMVADLYNFARTTPFDTPGVVKAAQQLLAYGFEAKQIKPLLTDIGDAAAAMGDLSTEHIGRITLALGQMHTAGVLHQEELNQLTENGIRASQYVAEAYGVSVQQLRKLIQTGQIDGDKAIQAIREGIRRDLGGSMDNIATSFMGLFSNLRDTASQILGRVFRPLFDRLKSGMQDVLARFQAGEFEGAIDRWQGRIDRFADGIATFAKWVDSHWSEISQDAEDAGQAIQIVAGAVGDLAKMVKFLADQYERLPGGDVSGIDLFKKLPGHDVSGIDLFNMAFRPGSAAQGRRLDRPHIIVAGEEAPTHPEFFVSTNPRDKPRSRRLARELVEGFLGGRVEFFQGGGLLGGTGWPSPHNDQAQARFEASIGSRPPLPNAFGWSFSSLAPAPMAGAFAQPAWMPPRITTAQMAGFGVPPPRPGITHQTLGDDQFTARVARLKLAYDMDMAVLDDQLGRAQQTPSAADDRAVQEREAARMRRRVVELNGLIQTAPDDKTRLALMQERGQIEQQIGSIAAGLRRPPTPPTIPTTFLTARQQFQLAEANRTHDSAAVRRLTQIDVTRTRAAMQRAAARGDFRTAAQLSTQLATLETTLKGTAQTGQEYLDQLRGEASELLSPGAAFTAQYGGKTHRLQGGDLGARAAGVDIEVATLHPASPRVTAKIARAWGGAVAGRTVPRRVRPAL